MYHKFDEILRKNYWARYQKFGSNALGSFWLSEERQEWRFKIIIDEIRKIVKTGPIELSDVGCGYGALVNYIRYSNLSNNVKYTGYDVSCDLINVCKNEIDDRWAMFKVGSQPEKSTMFTVMSGTYNLAATKNIAQWNEYVLNSLSDCWNRTLRAMIFNLQVSNKARISNENIYYANKFQVLEFCLSKFGPTKLVEWQELPKDATFVVLK